jgi:hypothetical protein
VDFRGYASEDWTPSEANIRKDERMSKEIWQKMIYGSTKRLKAIYETLHEADHILTIELVPESLWNMNVRAVVSKDEWDIIRKEVYKKAGYRCEICGGVGDKWPVECHERWEYDDKKRVQKLVGFIALCPNCHMVKHIGYANVRGLKDRALFHLARVNKIGMREANRMVDDAFREWHGRNLWKWTADMSHLDEYRNRSDFNSHTDNSTRDAVKEYAKKVKK